MLGRWIAASQRNNKKSNYQNFNKKNRNHQKSYSQSYYKKIKRRRAILLGVVATSLVVYKTTEALLDYYDEELVEKEKIIVLGAGFGALAFLDSVNPKKFDIQVVSPQSSFLFSPLIAEAAVGNVKIESIAEPVRSLGKRLGTNFDYFEAKCTDVNPENNTIICKGLDGRDFELSYDHLVVAVGSHNNTYDVPGIQNVQFLNSLNDARRVRNKLVENFERASLPGQSEETIKKYLSFVVVGSGPISMETVSRLTEYAEAKRKTQPELVDKMKITMISGYKDHINNYYDQAISNYFTKFFHRDDVTKEDTTVSGVNKDYVVLNNGNEIPYGMVIWLTGRDSNPLVDKICGMFPEQDNQKSLVTDLNLKIKGTDNIYAIGDCSTIDQGGLFEKWEKYFLSSDEDQSGFIDLDEFKHMLRKKAQKYPALYQIGVEAETYFEAADINKDGQLELDEFKEVMKLIDKSITRFPATATVATQQGTYLGNTFNKYYVPSDEGDDDDDDEIPPFRYKHIGGYEYVGAEEGFIERGSQSKGIVTGPGARWMWHAVYYSKSIPLKMRLAFVWDRMFSKIYGRSTTRY